MDNLHGIPLDVDSSAPTRKAVRAGLSRTAFWVLLLGALLRLLSFFLSVNNGGDALSRVGTTEAWLEHPSFKLFFGRYLPLHYWLMGGFTLLVRDVALAGRLLSLVLGIASLGLFWRLARELYGEAAATLSLVVFSLYSLHIAYSTTTSSEVPYLFFVLAGLVCFFPFLRSGEMWLLALAGIMLTLAAAIRYEAWVIIFAAALVLAGSQWRILHRGFWRLKHLRALVLFGVTAAAWPVFWAFLVWTKFGHSFYFLDEQRSSVAYDLSTYHRTALYQLALSPSVILLTLSPLVVVGSLYAIWLTVRERPGREFVFLLMIFAIVQFYQIASGGLLSLARYTLTLGTLLAVVSGYGLQRMAKQFFPRAVGVVRIVVAATLVLNLAVILAMSETRNRYSEKFGSVSPRLRFTHYIEDLGSYLRPRLGSDEAVVIDDYNYEANIVAAASGLPLQPGERAFLSSSRGGSELLDYMKAKHPRYVVYSDRGKLRPYLPLPPDCSVGTTFAGMEFQCVFENEVYRLYEVRYR